MSIQLHLHQPGNIFRLLATTISGLESLTKYEIQDRGQNLLRTEDRSLLFETDLRWVYQSLISSRYANRIYLVAGEFEWVSDFDELYRVVSLVDWQSLLPQDHPIIIDATSITSELSSIPSIQRVATKALHEQITLRPQYGRDEIHIELLLKKNRLSILLDITWEALHKRGYRKESGEAPLKETLAAALVTLSGYRGNTSFYDYFAGSGTIAIEAAMIARRIAPGLFRWFRIASLPWHDEEMLDEVLDKAEGAILPIDQCKNGDKPIKIFASDSDASMQAVALSNARRALVADMIEWRTGSFEILSRGDLSMGQPLHWVSNPPYGDRMELSDDLRWALIDFLKHPLTRGGIIMADEHIHEELRRISFKNRKFNQGGMNAYFYSK